MRIIEKNLRDEVINRCIEFLDVTLNFILYIEQIYSNDIFEKRLKYDLIVYECQDVDVQNYISDFLNQIKPLLREQLIDQIGLSITTDDENNILRRYIIELHTIVDHSSNTVHLDGNYLLAELDSIFSTCLIKLMSQKQICPMTADSNDDDDDYDKEQIHWKLQMRLSHHRNNRFDVQDTFYEQFKLIDNCLLSFKQLKSVHSQRLNIQLMYQDGSNKEK